MNDEAVYRTAPATPGLLIITKNVYEDFEEKKAQSQFSEFVAGQKMHLIGIFIGIGVLLVKRYCKVIIALSLSCPC